MNSWLDRTVVTERVLEVIKSFEKVDESKVTINSHLEKDLGLDSLDTVEVVMGIEEEFVLTMTDESADRIATVADAINYVCNHPHAKATLPVGYSFPPEADSPMAAQTKKMKHPESQ